MVTSERADPRPVFFFDIDNTLYSKSKKVQNMMGDLIDKYFMTHLSLSYDDANHLHAEYYKDYGLAIEGLVRHHKVNALEYNSKVDDALPLEDLIKPDPQLRSLLQAIDRSKVRLWLFTNAYINHGKRVVKLLQVDDLFEGITFCDYSSDRFVCKPHREMFDKAQREAGVQSADQCYFVGELPCPATIRVFWISMLKHKPTDDSALNCEAAQALGWTAIHIVENWDAPPAQQAAAYQIRDLQELRTAFPQFFKAGLSDIKV